MPRANYDEHKNYMANAQRERRAALGEVGDLPPVADPARRARCRESLIDFCETYRPAAFYLGWSDDHRRVIERIQATITEGGLFELAMPRGSGKTTLVITSAIWAILYGYRRWICLVGAPEQKATSLVRSIKTEMRFSELLRADFPEVCVPIAKIEGKAARAGSQTYRGVPTNIAWQVNSLTFPTVARPDYILLDDPQTRESARSATQTQDRLAIVNGDVLGLAGPGVKISGVMPCTVISRGDLADQILNRDTCPAWHGERNQLLYGTPTNVELWEQYQKILEAELRNDGVGIQATAFYRENQAAMDAGCRAAWPERHNPDEISGIQHAMNLRIRDEESFAAEYQHSPIETAESGLLSVEDLTARVNGYPRCVVPGEATKLTAMIDIQKDLLFYVVAAWREDFTGWVIDYGEWPDQGATNFTLNQARKTIGKAFPGASLEASIQQALGVLSGELCSRVYEGDGGAELTIDKLLIEANWGQTRDTVYRFVRSEEHTSELQSH